MSISALYRLDSCFFVMGHYLTPHSVTEKAIYFSKEPAAYVRDDRYMLLREYVERIANKLF